jgi:outer membrane lipoprotein-sorting protein
MRLHTIAILGIAAALPVIALPPSDLDNLLNRIDKAGAGFHAITAHLRRISHIAVINDDTVDSGAIRLKRTHPRDLHMLIDVTEPDAKTVAFQGHKLEIYYPKIKTVQEFDVGKSRALLEQFFLVGFGTSRADLEASYNLRLIGPETIDGQKTEHLELIPKSKEVLQHLTKFELWISDSGYPVQQKFDLKAGDYQLATYTDVKINPELPDADLKLQLPAKVKREYPQK